MERVLVTSGQSLLHIRQQTKLCVGDEGQSGAWVVCSRSSAKSNTKTLVDHYNIISPEAATELTLELLLTFQLDGCRIPR